ncbi:MAG: dephospho-CoA kinase [Chthonomonas sp.]|nr:dephospho-CoA kinase [Chthonomonas sp.]
MIAITGGAASGKSTILHALADRGWATISADQVVADLWLDETFLVGVAEVFDTARPTRELVRAAILREPAKRRALNELSHRHVIHTIFTSGSDVAEVPLLIEAGLFHRFNEVWVCSCDRETQLKRLQGRGFSLEDAGALLATQVADSVRCSFADEIFRTNGERSNVLSQIDLALRRSRTQDR